VGTLGKQAYGQGQQLRDLISQFRAELARVALALRRPRGSRSPSRADICTGADSGAHVVRLSRPAGLGWGRASGWVCC